MNAFAWLNDLMKWIARWFPRLTLIRATHRGVLFGRAGRVRELEPGLWCYWPIVSELLQVDMTERSSLLSAQVIGERLIAVAVVWRVVAAQRVGRKFRKVEARVENATRISVASNAGDMGLVHSELTLEFSELVEFIDIAAASDGPGFALKKFGDTASRDPDGLT